MFKVATFISSLFASIILVTASVSASTPQISIPVDTVVRGSVGSTHILAEESVSEELIGQVCEVMATAKNQRSVHPGNDIIVASGNDSVVLENVEREANGLTEAEGQVTLGSELTVTLRLGEDKVFSGGMNVELHCEQPEKVIEVCRDGVVITIPESERRDTDTSVPCPTPEVLPARTLPVTGPGAAAVTIAGLSGIAGTLGHMVYTRKKL